MTIAMNLIKERIKKMLYSSDNDCLAIKGKWGTGKTFIWKIILSQADTNKMQFENYSYVSLFGMNSLQQIKMAVVASMLEKNQ